MIIEEKNIFLNLSGSDKYEVFKDMIYSSDLEDKMKAYAFQKVKEREELQSTCVGNGIGVAHARFDGMDNIKVLMGVIKNGVEYESFDEKPVNLLFVILAPKEKSTEYLRTLSKISKICRKKDMLNKIINSDITKDILDVLKLLGD